MKTISIIIPVYNTGKYLEKCLNSILNEKVDKEIIIINDGSTDNSLEIIKKFQKKNKEIILINQKNSGQGKARNVGLNHATGKYICFIDSDDWLNKGSLEKAIAISEKENIDILYWRINWIFDDLRVKEQQIHSSVYPHHDFIGYLLSDPSPCNKLIKNDIFKKNNLEFPTDCIYEDFALIPSLVKYAKKIKYTDEIVYNYYQRNNSTMNQKNYNSKNMDLLKAYDHLYNSLHPKYKKELEYLAINQIVYYRTFELLKYNRKKEVKECLNYVNAKFPNWQYNKYYQQRNKFIKMYCKLINKKYYLLCKIMSYLRTKIRK